MFPNWDCTLIAVSASFHSVAILCTLFRLWYRWHTSRIWWDDTWAVPALLGDVACLIVTALEQPFFYGGIPRFFEAGNWIFSIAYPVVIWTTRISILAAIIRVSRPEGVLRHIALCIGIFFGLAGLAMLAVRLWLCATHMCLMTKSMLILQICVDCIVDVLLSVLPIWVLRDVKLGRKRKVLICSAFSASMVITVVTVVEAVTLFQSTLTSGSIVFEHVKVACSMIVCNLLVIVAFVYRILLKGDIEDPKSSKIEFTTIDPAQVELSQETSRGWLPSSANSSSWSFHDGQSKVSGSMVVAGPSVDIETVER